MLDFDVDASPEATAFVMRFLSHEKKDSPLLPKAALWLVNHRNEGYWWSSTKQTAMVIYGLTDYLKTTNELNPNLNVTVLVNDRPALTRKLDLTTSLSARIWCWMRANSRRDESDSNHGLGRWAAFITGRATNIILRRRGFEKTGTTSLNLLRDYFRLVPAKKETELFTISRRLTGSVAPGDIVAVRLTATGTPWKYVMLEDPFRRARSSSRRTTFMNSTSRPPWWNYFFSRRECMTTIWRYSRPGLPGSARLFLFAEGGELRGVYSATGTDRTYVSTRCHGNDGKPQTGGELMRQKVLIHFTVNAIVLALGYYWLGLAESRMGALVWSAFVALAALTLALWAYTASFVYREELSAPVAWRASLRHLPAVIVAGIVIALVYWGLAKWNLYSAKPAFRIASWLTLKLRKPVRPASVGLVFGAVLWAIRWVVLPVVFLPIVSAVARWGWSGFGVANRRPNRLYWIVTPMLLLCFLRFPLLLINWVPRVSGFGLQSVSFALRAALAYLLFGGAWLLLAFVTSGGDPRATQPNTVASP